MRPLFTIHAGEYLVGSYIERHFRRANVWVPSRDTGIDLLVSDRQNSHAVSLQVKLSKDWLVTHVTSESRERLRACGWWNINRDKLRNSPADFWVFVLVGFASRTTDFVVVPTSELQERMKLLHDQQRRIHSFLWVTNSEKCWETRGLRRDDERKIADGKYTGVNRDFTKWLNEWTPIAQLNA
jgi:hypothetical protein